MDDDFELVPKEVFAKLKEENAKLKEQVDKRVEKTENTQLLPEFKKLLEEEGKKERDLILKYLGEIKELNKSTLSNVLDKTTSLDGKLETIVGGLNGLLETLSELIDEFKNTSGVDSKEILQEIKARLSSEEGTGLKLETMEAKIEEIDEFMKNLRELLSQVKPNDMVKV